MLTIYHYMNCSTCRKARVWLKAHKIEHELIDIVDAPPNRNVLRRIAGIVGEPIKQLFNVPGDSYRIGDFKTRLKTMTNGAAIDALAIDGKLIRRPLVIDDKDDSFALIGFDEAEWKAALLKRR